MAAQKLLLLEYLGIPRLRVHGLSIFNFLGTFIVAYFLAYLDFINKYFNCFELFCLLIGLAVATHSILGEPTPLVKLVNNNTSWFILVLSMTFVALFKNPIYYYIMIGSVLYILFFKSK
jgi:hypothetical protein